MSDTIAFFVIVACIFVFASIVAFTISACVNWSTHVAMTTEHSLKSGRGNRHLFWHHFAEHDWERRPHASTSYFDGSTDSEIHASIFRFDGVGMVLGLIDYTLVEWQLRRCTKSVARHQWSTDRPAR